MDDDPWARYEVSDWEFMGVETAGSSSAQWLAEPGTERRWLHKSTTIPVSTGAEQGEDWAEVVSTRTASLLGVPCAETRLCMRNDRRGSLSLDVRPDGYDLNEGQVILQAAQAPGYFPTLEGAPGHDPARPTVRRPGHNLVNIRSVLADVRAPAGFRGPSNATGFDAFVGYLIMDALIANRDRHEQNWAVLRPRLLDEDERLAPSYDHSGSLGYNLTDDMRSRLVSKRDEAQRWAEKGTAHRFEHDRRKAPTLVSLAGTAMGLCSPQGASWWRTQLAALDLAHIHEHLTRGVPGMSEAAATFAGILLDINLRRLRDAICTGP